MNTARVKNDLTIYETHGAEWWNPRSPYFRSLQNISPFRLSLIESWTGDFHGKVVYDLGCGGGLLSIPLIKRGAIVTGVDLSPRSIATATAVAHDKGTFLVGDIRRTSLPAGSADIVLLADVLDHLPDYPSALSEAARLLKPHGMLFVSTINRNLLSRFFAITLGEGLGLIPPGTHDPRLFIKPQELCEKARAWGLQQAKLCGESVDFIATIRRWAITLRESSWHTVAYAALFRKESL